MPALCLSAGATLFDQRQRRLDPGVAGVEVPAAAFTANDCVGDSAAIDVDQISEESLFRRAPLVTPTPHRHEEVVKITALFRQPVFESWRPILVWAEGEDACFDQHRQTVGQNIAGDPEVLLEVIEPANAEKGVAKNQDSPTIADQFCGVRHGAVEMLEALASRDRPSLDHGLRYATNSPRLGCVRQLTISQIRR